MTNVGADDAAGIVINVRLYEDVAAELEEFILYSRLGLTNEATQILDTALWHHLQFFPVVAEVALFPIQQQDVDRLQKFLQELRERNILHDDPDEARFIQVLKLLTPNSTKNAVSATDANTARQNRLDRLAAISDQVFERLEYQRPTQVQTAELVLSQRLLGPMCSSSEQLRTRLESHRCMLTKHSMLWEATCVFSIECSTEESRPSHTSEATARLGRVHSELTSSSVPKMPNLDIEVQDVALVDEMLCQLHCHMAYINLLEASTNALPNANEFCQSLCQNMKLIVQALFPAITDRTPRGSIIEFLLERNFEISSSARISATDISEHASQLVAKGVLPQYLPVGTDQRPSLQKQESKVQDEAEGNNMVVTEIFSASTAYQQESPGSKLGSIPADTKDWEGPKYHHSLDDSHPSRIKTTPTPAADELTAGKKHLIEKQHSQSSTKRRKSAKMSITSADTLIPFDTIFEEPDQFAIYQRLHGQGGDYGNALQMASADGHEKIVQILLNKGAEVNTQGGIYGNALQAASAGGYEKIVQILLDTGAEVNAQGGYYSNALQAASAGGYEKVVQILLDKGAEVNTQGGRYGNALQAASAGGCEKVVQMLLDTGAEVNTQGGCYGNALQAASARGHKKVVQILLGRGATLLGS